MKIKAIITNINQGQANGFACRDLKYEGIGSNIDIAINKATKQAKKDNCLLINAQIEIYKETEDDWSYVQTLLL